MTGLVVGCSLGSAGNVSVGEVVPTQPISASFTPIIAPLYDGQAIADIPQYASMVALGNFASQTGNITSADVTFTGDVVAAGSALSEGDSAGFSVTVSDDQGNTRVFDAGSVTVEYAVQINVIGNEAEIDINPRVPDTEMVTVTVSGATAYDGSYSRTAGALRGGPVLLASSVISGVTGLGDTLSVDSGLWTTPTLVLNTTYQWLSDGTPIAGATGESLVITAAEQDTNVSVEITVDDGSNAPVSSETAAIAIPSGTVPHMLMIAGQSNAVGRVVHDGGTDYPTDGSILMIDRGTGALVNALRPLAHADPIPDGMGFALELALGYQALHPEANPIIIAPCADGGTGFSSNDWNPGDPYYEGEIARVNAALTADPTIEFKGIFWHQGERDALDGAEATYQANLDAMFAAMRTDIVGADAMTPVLVGGLGSSFYATNSSTQAVQAIIEDTPNRILASYVSSDGLQLFDGLHFDAPALRTLGQRFLTAYEAFINPQVPAQVTGLTVDEYDGTCMLSWDVPDGNGRTVTDYQIRRDGALLATVGSNATQFEDTGVSNGTAYVYEVAAINSVGTGPYSDTVTGIPRADYFSQTGIFEAIAGNNFNKGTITSPAHDIGTAAADRRILVTVGTTVSLGSGLPSLTIGGVSATLLGVSSTSHLSRVAMFTADVPTGDTADIVFSLPAGSTFRESVIVAHAYGGLTAQAAVTGAGGGSGVDVSQDTQAGDIVFGAAVTQDSTGTTFDSLTTEYLVDLRVEEEFVVAQQRAITPQTPRPINATSSVQSNPLGAISLVLRP